MAKKTLKIDYTDDFDFMLIGISSGSKDFKLCHFLNVALGKNFVRTGDHELIMGKNNSSVQFSKFVFDDEQGHNYILVGNKSNDVYLIPELKNMDYFLLIQPSASIEANGLLEQINAIDLVQAVFLIDVNTLKSKYNFLASIPPKGE